MFGIRRVAAVAGLFLGLCSVGAGAESRLKHGGDKFANPTVIAGNDIAAELAKLSWETPDSHFPVRFQIFGLCFEGDVLWLSTSQGLVEILDGHVIALHRWRANLVGSVPWLDPAGKNLYVINGDGLMMRESEGWRKFDPPPIQIAGIGPCTGSLILTIFSQMTFTGAMEGSNVRVSCLYGRSAPLWNAKTKKWDESKGPTVPQWNFSTTTVVRNPHGLCYLVREEKGHYAYMSKSAKGEWLRRAIPSESKTFANQMIATDKCVYIRIDDGKLFEVTKESIVRVESPGYCEALTCASDGALLASFHNLGVFRLGNEWRKLCDIPYVKSAADPRERMISIAENAGVVGLMTAPVSYLHFTDKSDLKYESLGDEGVWIIRNGKATEVDLGPFLAADPTRN